MAKDVITRFKLETTGFDSKIKEAAKELSAYSKTATQAKEGFNQFTKANVDAARALGTMATSTTNVKDKVKELVGAYNNAAKAYEALTKEQQQSDWAKALAGSLTQLQQRIKETKAEMQGLGDSMKGANDGSLLSKLGGKMDGALAVFGGNLMTKAAGMGVGLVTEMTDAVKQGIELAKAGEGVRIAFERLGRGDILQGLREATHGTVTDLELMKAAVKFNDFKLPVEELGTMLAFAQQKAKDTGQSVDYMVDSIVTGLGRKSLMILDNLGLSASEIRERMKETGDMTKAVGAIIREQMASAGEYVETAADRAAQANVSLQNKMEELGRKVAPLEESFNNLWTSMKVGILDVIGGPLTDLLNKLTQAGRMASQYSLMGGNTKVGRMTSNLSNASEDSRQSIYQLQKSQFWKYINPREQQIKDIRAWQSGERNESLQKRINVITQKYGSLDTTKIQAEVDAAKKMLSEYEQAAKPLLNPVNVNVNTKQAEQNVASLRKQLKELEEQRKKAVTAGDQEQVENLTKQISQVKTNIGYLDPKANKTGSSSKTAQTELQKNQAKINALTQEYVKLGDESTEAARERQAEIQKEIELLKERNGLLGLRSEQAQGRLLSTDDMKRKAEIDMQVNTKQIEDLRRQLAEIEKTTATVNVDATNSPDFLGFSRGAAKPREAGGIGISPKSVTITATDEAMPKLREIEGITIDDKTMTVTAETADALRALQGIEGVTIDPKSVTITATDEALPKLREIEGITIDDKTMTVTAETADALRALQGIEGVTIDPKSVSITATDEDFRKQLAEIEKTTATVNVDATNSPDFLSFSKGAAKPREAGGIGSSTKSVTITATDEAMPKLREIEGITIDDKTMTVTAETADALRALQSIEGVAIDPKTVTITATDEALPKLREIQGITIDDKTMTVTAETADALRALQAVEGVTIDPKSVTITATDEALPKLREIEGITIDDKTMTVTAETADALRALQGIDGVTIDPKSVSITATDEALPKLREIEGITIDDKTMTVTAETADSLRALQGIEGVTIEPKTIDVNANTSEAQQKIDELKAKIAELEDKNINIKAFVDNIDKPLGEGLNKTPGTLLKAPDTTIPRGGLQLDDKDMKAVRKNIDDRLPKKEKKDSPMDSSKKMLNAISQLTGGLQQMGVELPSEIQGVIGVIQGAMQVIEAVNTIIGVTQTTALTANTAAMVSLEAALWANTATSIIPFANGGIVPGFANGGVIDSGHSPSFLSFSKAAPSFATGGVVPQTFTSMPKFATGGIIQKFNDGGTVEAGHAPDFLSFSKAMPKFATGGIIQKFNEGGTVEAGHAPDFLSFSKAMPRRFASGGTVPHAANGYFIGGSHFSGDVTPIMANAGELVLNKAQQGVIANQLQGGNKNNVENRQPYVNGELIYLGLNNYLKRTGRGEIVVSKR